MLGTTADLPRLVRELDIDHVIITIGEIQRKELRRLVEVCESVPVRVRTIPGLYEILQGRRLNQPLSRREAGTSAGARGGGGR